MRDLLKNLQKIGYSIILDGDSLLLTWTSDTKPDLATVKPLLDELRVRKVEAVRYLQGGPVDPRCEGRKARELLDRQGWCAVKSHPLGGEIIVWVDDGKVVIPVRWQNNAVYTLGEIAALAVEPRVTADGLRRIHRAKKLFNGTVTREGETP